MLGNNGGEHTFPSVAHLLGMTERSFVKWESILVLFLRRLGQLRKNK